MLPVGCVETPEATLDVYLDEVEFQNSSESAREIELGEFTVASALQSSESEYDREQAIWVDIRFRLIAIVDADDEDAVQNAASRHRGLLDDTIITVCRETTKEELADSRWATFKARLIDAVRPILGETRIRQLSFADFSCEII